MSRYHHFGKVTNHITLEYCGSPSMTFQVSSSFIIIVVFGVLIWLRLEKASGKLEIIVFNLGHGSEK